MSRCYRFALPLGAMLALTGCSSPLMSSHAPPLTPEAGQRALASANDCCRSLADLPYQPLPASQSLALAFTPDTPAHDFGDGKSFFHAFRLPRTMAPLTLELTSAVRAEQVIAPSILILDDNFRPVQRISSDALNVRRPSGFSPARLGGELTLAPGADASYLVIYTSREDRRGATIHESEQAAYARVRGLARPADAEARAQHTATGEIDLSIAPVSGGDGLTVAQPSTATRDSERLSAPDTTPAPQSAPLPETFDYRRMINAALTAGDIELALELAERAERNGQAGTRAWLAERLRADQP